MTYCGHLVGLPSHFFHYIKELIGLIISRVLGLIIPRAEKGVELVGSTPPPPGAMDLVIPRMDTGVELIGSTPPGVLGLFIPRMEKEIAQIGLALFQKKIC